MIRTMVIAALGFAAFLPACSPQSSTSFDPQDPEVIAVIDSIMDATMESASRVDPEGVLDFAQGGEDFILLTGDVMLTDLETVEEAFSDTYSGLLRQDQTVYEMRTRLLSPDVVVLSAVGEGTYTDRADWTSEPVGLGLTVVFVREDGRWIARHVHQSVAK